MMVEKDKLQMLWKQSSDEHKAYAKDRISNMLEKESRNVLKRFIVKNIVSQIFTVLVLIGIILGLIIFRNNLLMLLTNIGSLILTSFFFALTINELKHIKQINPSKQRVFEVQERYLRFKKYLYRQKLYGFVLGPILVLFLLPLTTQIIAQESIFSSWQLYLTSAISGVVFFYPTFLIMYKLYYSKGLKKLNQSIQELLSYDQ